MKNYYKLGVIGLLIAIVVALIGIGSSAGANTLSANRCIPVDAYTETVHHAEVSHEEEIFDHWQRYSWTGGPHESDSAPAFPSDDWQPNVAGDPHGIGQAGAYFMSHGNSGNGDWFYLEAVMDTILVVDKEAWTEKIRHDAITCEVPKPDREDECVDPITGADLCTHETPEPPNDPVVEIQTHTSNEATIRIKKHESGHISREITVHDMAGVREEGM